MSTGDFSPTLPGATASNPSSTTGSYQNWSPTMTGNYSVYWGSHTSRAYDGRMLREKQAEQWYTATMAKNMYGTFSDDQYRRLNKALNKLPNGTFRSTAGLWNKAVDYARAAAANGQKVTPWDVIDGIQSGKGPGSDGSGGSGGGSFTSTSTSTAYSKTSKSTGERLLNTVLSAYLGREASEKEIKNFMARLNGQEESTPTNVSTSTTTSSGSSSHSSSTSRSNTGVDPQQKAIDFAKSRDDYAEYQYATTYMDAFLGALGSPVAGT